MILEHKDYTTPEVAEKIIPDVKETIRTFVGKGRKTSEEIKDHIQLSYNITNDNIEKQIKEVSKEEDYIKPVVEKVEEIGVVSK